MSEPLSERDLLRLIRGIVLAGRRAKKAGSSKLTRALDDAGYYAGLELGRLLKQSARAHAEEGQHVKKCKTPLDFSKA
jgi:hypothetical protein